MIGAEGKLFRPLAFTKTFALAAALIIALFLIPPFAASIFKKAKIRKTSYYVLNGLMIVLGLVIMFFGYWIGILLIGYGIVAFLKSNQKLTDKRANLINIIISALAIVFLLAEYWRPLGVDKSIILNLIFVSIICFGLLGVFVLFQHYYSKILKWALENRLLFLTIPTTLLIFGFYIMKNTGYCHIQLL